MKKVLVTAIAISIFALGGTAFAQRAGAPMIDAGSQEIGVSGNIDFEDTDGKILLNLFGSYGYFIQDNVEVGVRVGYLRRRGGDEERINVGGFGEFHFPVTNVTVPYVGADLDYAYADLEPGGSENSLVLSPKVGVKWFIREHFAIDTNIYFAWADEDIFVNDNEPDDTDWGARIGLRVYFK
jgi:hypothetical protein